MSLFWLDFVAEGVKISHKWTQVNSSNIKERFWQIKAYEKPVTKCQNAEKEFVKPSQGESNGEKSLKKVTLRIIKLKQV